MSTKLQSTKINLKHRPKSIDARATRIVLGDIHGNSQYLLNLLIKFGVIILNKKHYRRLIAIYNKNTDALTAEDLLQFRRTLRYASYNTGLHLLFLGDTLSDRGENDFFTLCIFRRLSIANVPFTILLSNHDVEFLHCHELSVKNSSSPYQSKHIKLTQTRSMQQMQQLLELKLCYKNGKNCFTVARLNEWVSTHLLKHYRAIDYSLENNELTLYTHAPIDVDIIQGIALQLGTAFADETVYALISSIDQINEQASDLIKKNRLCAEFKGLGTSDNLAMDEVDPFTRLIWNRARDNLNLSANHHGYQLRFVHGHDRVDSARNNVISLDQKVAKNRKNYRGDLFYLSEYSLKSGFFQNDSSDEGLNTEPSAGSSLLPVG